MKIAVTVWNNRVSPVFDSARTFLLVEIENNKVAGCSRIPTDVSLSAKTIKLVETLRVDLLICGALSCMAENLLKAGGVEVIPFIGGEAEEVVSVFLSSGDLADFTMPGCPRRKWRKRGTGGAGKKGFSSSCCRRVIRDNLTADTSLFPEYLRKKQNC